MGIMAVVAEVMRLSLNDVAVGTIRDPEAVQKMIEDGMGSCLTLQLGAKKDMPSIGRNGEPLEVTGIVKVISHFPARAGYENLGFFPRPEMVFMPTVISAVLIHCAIAAQKKGGKIPPLFGKNVKIYRLTTSKFHLSNLIHVHPRPPVVHFCFWSRKGCPDWACCKALT